MLIYQIRFCDSKGNGHFEYLNVKTKKGVEKKAAEAATKHIIEIAEQCKRSNGTFDMYSCFRVPSKPQKIVHVWEYDDEKKEVKKGGHRFKLSLSFFQATYNDGSKHREEWYEPVSVNKIKK